MSSDDIKAGKEGRLIVPTVVDRERGGRGVIGPITGIMVEVVGGPMDGEQRRAGGDTLTIGRAEENDLPLPLDPSVSTHHASITQNGGQFWLEDQESTNGTYIGETQVKGRIAISPGAIFVVGRTTLELMSS